MKLLVLSEGACGEGSSPATRFRICQLLPVLASHGIEVTVRSSRPRRHFVHQPPWTSLRDRARPVWSLVHWVGMAAAAVCRLSDALRASHYDCTLIQRELIPAGPPVLERLVIRLSKRVVFDFDDAVFLSSYNQRRGIAGKLLGCGRVEQIIRGVDAVSAGNEFLAAHAREFNLATFVVPTAVDCAEYAGIEHSGNEDVIVGWVGTFSNMKYLQLIWPQIAEAQRDAPFHLRILTNMTVLPFDPGHVDYSLVQWSLATERDELSRFDIGLMPLDGSTFSQGKCGMKLLQYGAVGIPCVATATQANRSIVEDGTTGYLIDTGGDWVGPLTALARDGGARRRMGSAARERVRRLFDISVIGSKLAAVLSPQSEYGGHRT